MWGTLGYFAKLLYAEGVSVEALATVRAGLAWATVTVFLLLTRRARRALRVSVRDLAFLFPMGVSGIGLFYLSYYYTVQEGAIGTAALLLYSYPAFVVILARLFLDESVGLFKLGALVLTATGVFLVAGGYNLQNLEIEPLVLGVGLLSGLSFGMYAIFGRPLTRRLDSAIIVFYALGFGSALLLPIAAPTLQSLAGLPLWSYALILSLAVIHTALGFALYTFGLKRLEAGQAAILATVEPVVAVALGTLLLNESLTLLKLGGGLMVISGAALAQLKSRRTRDSH